MIRKALWYQGPFFLACMAIFGVSSLSTIPTFPLPIWQDKIPHAIAFGTLAFLAYRAFRYQSSIGFLASSPAVSAVLFSAIYGALDEYHQSFVPGRTTDVWDFVADVVGAIIVISTVRWMSGRKALPAEGAPFE